MRQALLTLMCAAALTASASVNDVFIRNGLKFRVISETAPAVAVVDFNEDVEANLTIPATTEYNHTQYSVTTIGELAFCRCKVLESISLPATLTEICDAAFLECSNIAEFKLEEGNTTFTSLNGAILTKDESCIVIYPPANTAATFLIPDATTRIAPYAFGGSQIQHLNLNNVSLIGARAFNECSKLEEVTFPREMAQIGNGAFSYCTALKSLDLPASLVAIGDNTFEHCKAAASITFPENLESIGYQAFQHCEAVAACAFPESLKSIGGYAFYECPALKTISVGANVEMIADGAFRSCRALEAITVAEANASYASADGVLFDKGMATLLLYPSMKVDAHYIVPQTVKVMSRYSFANASLLEQIDLPETLTEMGDDVFIDCSALKSISIPASISTYGSFIFYNCTGLAEVELPANLVEIPNGMFYCCTGLQEMTIPASVRIIGKNAFNDCSGLYEVFFLPTTVPELDNTSFLGVASGATAYVPKGTKSKYRLALNGFSAVEEFGGVDLKLDPIEMVLAPGESATITATEKCGALASVVKREWSSFREDVATVDQEGKVTAVAEGYTSVYYRVTDNFGDSYERSCSITVKSPTGVNTIETDTENAEYFNLQGIRINDVPTQPGIYIRRSANGESTLEIIK